MSCLPLEPLTDVLAIARATEPLNQGRSRMTLIVSLCIPPSASGDDCGDIKCLHDIGMCVTDGLGNQTCECNPDYKNQVLGDGALACYKNSKLIVFLNIYNSKWTDHTSLYRGEG